MSLLKYFIASKASEISNVSLHPYSYSQMFIAVAPLNQGEQASFPELHVKCTILCIVASQKLCLTKLSKY